MKNDASTDKICVRLCDENGTYISSYHTTNLRETLAMYDYVCEHDIPIDFKEDPTGEGGKEIECDLDEVRVNFGGGDNLLSIDLYCSITKY